MNIALLLALSLTAPPAPVSLDTATFAGGCFWTMEHAYDDVPGVLSATSGFMGGTVKNPTYMQVVEGNTGHLESVQVIYDPAKVSYETLLWTFWHNIDPFQADGQACDTGPNYHTAVFVRGPAPHGRPVLSGRGVPPGLRQEESGPLWDVPHRLRARPAAARDLGRRGGEGLNYRSPSPSHG